MNLDRSAYAFHSQFADEIGGSMHLAVELGNSDFLALNSSVGVLYPNAAFDEGKRCGTTKILVNPWVFRLRDESFGIVALRRNLGAQGAAVLEPGLEHCALLFRSKDLLSYEELGLVAVAPTGVAVNDIRCCWVGEKYAMSAATDRGFFSCFSADLSIFDEPFPGGGKIERQRIPVEDAAPACQISLTESEWRKLVDRLAPLENTGVKPIELTFAEDDPVSLPDAELIYSDGSTFRMPVDWAPIDRTRKGTITVRGKPRMKCWPFPLTPPRGDPMAIRYRDRYYYMATDDEHGQLSLKIRETGSLDRIAEAEDHTILSSAPSSGMTGCFWAPELHLVGGRLFVFFAVGNPHWHTVQSHVMELKGEDPTNPSDWSSPRRCEKKDGKVLNDGGITLDMTVLDTGSGVYVLWAQRDIDGDLSDLGSSDLYIAAVEPREPWRLASDPVRLHRPSYGWERAHAEVCEGPFLLRRGENLFVTYAAALVDHTYSVGLLHARDGADLLDPASWQVFNYPLLHRHSVPDQIGGGHNSFVKDERGEDVLMLHAIPIEHYRNSPSDWRRYPTFRMVHWDAAGFPRLDMTPERQLNGNFAEITATVHLR